MSNADTHTTDSISILVDAADTITERGKQRELPNGERSMGRCVQAFNAIYGTVLSEQQGWQFMALLKIAQSASDKALRIDDYIDQSACAALAGECAARAQSQALQINRNNEAANTAIDTVRDLLDRKRDSRSL
jgi:hypothetical protein